MSTDSVRSRLTQIGDEPWELRGLEIVDRNGVARATLEWGTEGDGQFIAHAPTDLWLALRVIEAVDRQTVAYSRLSQAQRLNDPDRIKAADDEATKAEHAYWEARQAFEAGS